MQNAGLDDSQAGIKIVGRNINNLRNADDTTLMADSEEGLKSLLMRMKKKSEKALLKFNIQKTKIIASSPITSWQIEGGKWNQWQTFFSWALKSLWAVTAAMKLKDAHWKESYDKPDSVLKSRDITLLTKVCIEGWTLKNWCFWTVVLEKILASPLDCREIKAVNLKGNQSWISIGKTDAEAEAPILWPRDGKVQIFGKDPDAGKDWRQKRRRTT